MELFKAKSLNDAILALEVVVQRDPQNSDAWRWLGTAHAENDEDKLYLFFFLLFYHLQVILLKIKLKSDRCSQEIPGGRSREY